MACDVRVVNAGPMPVWSDRTESPSTGLFIHLTGFQDSAEIERVRITMEIRSMSGTMEVLPGYQVANEATSPGNAYGIGSTYVNSEGIDYGSGFTDISGNLSSQQLVRFGVFVRNTNGSTHTELALLSMRIEMQARA